MSGEEDIGDITDSEKYKFHRTNECGDDCTKID